MAQNIVETTPTVATSSVKRRTVFSGIQPSGNFHLGNYLGAIRNWVADQERYDSIFSVVDLHALSLATSRESMRTSIQNLAITLLASGIDSERSMLFVQSDVHEHTELCWLLNSVTQFGELTRMTQFKDKSAGKDEAVSAALFVYPVLQAADIILYDADRVPVGEDQKQHVELTRDIAHRFNTRYGDTFVLPKPDIRTEGARIMSLDDPTTKMSKSNPNPNSYIALSDTPDVITKKVKRAVTDSGSDVIATPDKPAVTNLMTIYALLADITLADVQERFAGKGYGAFKSELADIVVASIEPIQTRIQELEASPDHVSTILTQGAERARAIAAAKMEIVRDRMGIGAW